MSNVQLSPPRPPARRTGIRPIGVLALIGVGLALTAILVGVYSGLGVACRLDIAGACPGSSSQSLSAQRAAQPETTSADGTRLTSFELGRNGGAELDTDPPSAVRSGDRNFDHGDLFYDSRNGSRTKLYTADHPMAVWSGAGAPNSDQCEDRMAAAGVWSVAPSPGQIICVLSTEGQVAALTVTGVDADEVAFDAAIWG